MKRPQDVAPGTFFGAQVVIGAPQLNSAGRWRVKVRCNCGATRESDLVALIRLKPNGCMKCRYARQHGRVINNDQLVSAWNSSASTKDVALQIGVSVGVLYRLVKHRRKMGLPLRSRKRRYNESGQIFIGQRFGRMTVIKYQGSTEGNGVKNKAHWWLLRCDCGIEKTVRASGIKKQGSCRCAWNEKMEQWRLKTFNRVICMSCGRPVRIMKSEAVSICSKCRQGGNSTFIRIFLGLIVKEANFDAIKLQAIAYRVRRTLKDIQGERFQAG